MAANYSARFGKEVRSHLRDSSHGPYDLLNEELSILKAARNNLGAKPLGVITDSTGNPYDVFAQNGQDYESLARDVLNGPASPRFEDRAAFDDAVADYLGVGALTPKNQASFVADANAAAKVAGSARRAIMGGAGHALANAGAALTTAEGPALRNTLAALGVTEERLQARYGNGLDLAAIGQQMLAEDAAIRTAALKHLELRADQLAASYGAAPAAAMKAELAAQLGSSDPAAHDAAFASLGLDREAIRRNLGFDASPTGASPTGANPTGADPTGANPTGADPTGANPTGAGVKITVDTPRSATPPYLRDLPFWAHGLGLTAAGAGYGALAYHLMANGGQQPSNAGYNKAMQDMAAY